MAAKPDFIDFTEEMRKEYKILIPNALPIHFELMREVFIMYGYNLELLNYEGREVLDTGLKYVHNDTCYPGIVVVGQLMHALLSGDYDIHKTALMLYQTGGGCRASNYVHLLRRALKQAGLGFVPVISINFGGIEKYSGFKVTLPMFAKGLMSWLYGDFLMLLYNQTKPYEKKENHTDKMLCKWNKEITRQFKANKGLSNSAIRKNFIAIADDFSKIPVYRKNKVKVGIVGELYVKYAKFGNNHLQEFLQDHNCEVRIPGILGFAMYSLSIGMEDKKLYGEKFGTVAFSKLSVKYIEKLEQILIDVLSGYKCFEAPMKFSEIKKLGTQIVGSGVKMGEGWLLPAEMMELEKSGVKNLICCQPFGCLPNHIVGKGVIRKVRELNPDSNICAIDYDAGAARVNQENRIKLMLAVAQEKA